MSNRRSFLGAILALATAPAIVSASSLMPIRTAKIWVPSLEGDFTIEGWIPPSTLFGAFDDVRVSKGVCRYSLQAPPITGLMHHIAVQREMLFVDGVFAPYPSDREIRAANYLVMQFSPALKASRGEARTVLDAARKQRGSHD